MFKTCTIDGKAVKRLYINKRLAYSSEPDQMALANAVAMNGDFGSKVAIGNNSYVFNGQTYNYTVYDMPEVPAWSSIGSGNDNPWFMSPSIVATAAHYATALKTGTWTGSGGKTYNIQSWTNLRTWALANGFTEADLSGMTDIGDIVVAVNGAGGTTLDGGCPYFMPTSLVKTAFWNGSLQGTVGYHVPQKSLSTTAWTCDPDSFTNYDEVYVLRAIEQDSNLVLQSTYESDQSSWGEVATQPIDSTTQEVTFADVGPNGESVVCQKTTADMKLLAPVVMQSDFSWQTPKAGYNAIPSRDSTTKSTAQSYENTYLAYVGDSGKPTFVNVNGNAVVVSQCYSQFAGPDFCACLPVLSAYAAANNQELNILTEAMLNE